MIMNHSLRHQQDDLYFRSVSAYYAFLILCIAFYWTARKNRWLAILSVITLLSSLRFFLTIVTYHLDSYRIFFLLLSWIFLAYSIKRKDRLSLFLLGIFSGFAAFTHLIGVVTAVVNILTLFLFDQNNLKQKLIRTLTVGLLLLLFGGIHYLLEALYGAKMGFLTYF
jgi:4-amino-4-deoxy-L-arabinose transferase-like glycosyltransferase